MTPRGRRVAAAACAVLALATAPGPASALLLWSLAATPLTATAGQSTTFTLTAVNLDVLTELGCLEVDLPPGFVIESVGDPTASNGDDWSSFVVANSVVAHSLSGGGRLELTQSVAYTITARPTAAGAWLWTNHAHRQQDCTGADEIGVPLAITVLPALLPTPAPPTATPTPTPTPTVAPTPTPIPTPKPTPTATPRLAPTPTPPPPVPTLPLPSLPLPSLPLPSQPSPSLGPAPTPTASPRATAASPRETAASPRATAAPITREGSPSTAASPTPAALAAQSPPPAASPSPVASTSDEPDPSPEAVGGAGPPTSGATTSPSAVLPVLDENEIDVGLEVLGLIGDFQVWFVPAAVVGVPGLLVILWVALQAIGALAWIPAVRRLSEEEDPRLARRRGVA